MRVPETLTHVTNVVKKVILQENILMNKKMVATVGKGWAGVSIIKEKGLKDVLIVNRKIICLEIAQSQMIDQKVATIVKQKIICLVIAQNQMTDQKVASIANKKGICPAIALNQRKHRCASTAIKRVTCLGNVLNQKMKIIVDQKHVLIVNK